MALDAGQWLNILLIKLGFTLMVISAVMIDQFRPRGHYSISAAAAGQGKNWLAIYLAMAIIVLITSIVQMVVCIVQLFGKMPDLAWQICMLVFFIVYVVTFFVIIDVITAFLVFAAITFTVIFAAVIFAKAKPRAEAVAASLIHVGSRNQGGSSESGSGPGGNKKNLVKGNPDDDNPKKVKGGESSSEDGEIDGEPTTEKTGGKKNSIPKNFISGIKKTGSGIGKVGKKNKNKKGADNSGEASGSSDEGTEAPEPAENLIGEENV